MIEEHQLILGKFLAGTASDAEANAIMAAIDSDGAIGAEAIEQWELDGELQQLAVDEVQFNASMEQVLAGDDWEACVLAARVTHRLRSGTRPGMPRWSTTLAALVAIALGVGLWFQFSTSPSVLTPVPVHATIASASDVRWASGAVEYAVGDPLHHEVLHLASGQVVLTFGKDDQIVLSGPAELQIQGDRLCSLHAGSLVATTAEGFEVVTPQGRVVDRGTRFSVRVSKEQKTSEVKVFAGRVDVFAGSQPGLSLVQDEGVVLDEHRGILAVHRTFDLPNAIFDHLKLAIAPNTTGLYDPKKIHYDLSLNPDRPWIRKLSDTQYRSLKFGRDWKAWEKYFAKKHSGFVADGNPNVFWLLCEDHPFDGRGAQRTNDFHDHIFRCVVDPAKRTITIHPDPGWEMESLDRAWLVSATEPARDLLSPPGVIQNGDTRIYVLNYGPILERMGRGK